MSDDKPFGYAFGTPSVNAVACGGKPSRSAVSPLRVYATEEPLLCKLIRVVRPAN
ncbi:hypothetical protein [Brasilonema bromeliae]|uniref:hypothetical protein n=1 Tax=Brasilonema bromeliae TaxID=383615 RepID=UPI00145C64B7|nr:hypothetical protein [Brasilonema bromeliae]